MVDPFVAAEDINEPGLQKTTLEALFREADIVSLHLSSGPHSDGLVNAALLNSMKPGALLINTSRAAVVDEAALIDALRHGPLGVRGAGCLSPRTAVARSSFCHRVR